MNILIIIAISLLALSVLFVLYRVARGSRRPESLKDWQALIQPLDVWAFNNLMDPAEEDFLKANLRPSVFRRIQRLRLRAALDYVRCAAGNASTLVRAGQAAGREPHPDFARQGQEMVTAAIHLRLLSIFVFCLLCVKIAFPGLRLSLAGISNSHRHLLLQLGALAQISGT